MRRFAFPLLLPLLACDPSSTSDPVDGGDAATTVDAAVDAGDAVVPADAAPDGPTPDAGSPGYCESQWKGASILVLGVTPSGGSSLYHVYPEAQWDEHVVDLVYNGNNLSVADMLHETNVFRVTNGVAWWTLAEPLGTGTRELGAPIGFGPNGTPPTIAYLAPGAPWVGRGGTTLTQIGLAPLVDWKTNGNVLGAGASCTMRDFLSGDGLNPIFTMLATCASDPNAVVTATVTKDGNGNWTGSSTVSTLPNSGAVSGAVLGVSKTVMLTATKIYASGVYVRDLKVCLNDGNLAAPIAGLRAVIE